MDVSSLMVQDTSLAIIGIMKMSLKTPWICAKPESSLKIGR